MAYPGMKSCTVRGSQIMASHHIGQSYVPSDFIHTFSFPHLFQQKEAIERQWPHGYLIWQQLKSNSSFHLTVKLPKAKDGHDCEGL